MQHSIKRTALSLCLAASIATPVWASEPAPATDPNVVMVPVAAAQEIKVPSKVTVDGKTVTFDQGPVMVDGVLFVPVRTIAEAAGGVVTWDAAIRLSHVRMPERTIMIRLEHQEAEMHQDGVYYLTRNVLQMKRAPLLMGGRTLVSADALTKIFGFQATSQADGTLTLTSPTKTVAAPVAPVTPAAPIAEPERGTVTQVEEGRFLVSGPAMANGEPRMTWASITKETKITVDGDQKRDGAMSDITPGAQVAVTWAGPLLESYPARGAAAQVVVTATKPATAVEKPAAPAIDVEQGTVVAYGNPIRDGASAINLLFLLKGAPMANGEPLMSWVAVTEKTKITVREGDQTRAGAVDDITEGAQVEVTWDGVRTMSYPARGTAGEIVVLK